MNILGINYAILRIGILTVLSTFVIQLRMPKDTPQYNSILNTEIYLTFDKKIEMKTILTIVLLSIASLAFAQTSKQDSIWRPMKYFIGTWKGIGESNGEKGDYERSYQFVLNKKFIEINNKSTYPPTDKKTKGEVHEDKGYISYDKGRKTFILRQFHIEGFVNQYKLDSISLDSKTIVFISESIENIPTGWRAKETYQIVNDGEFMETFELAEPNKGFELYSKVTLKIVK